jgi:hypothetical protein
VRCGGSERKTGPRCRSSGLRHAPHEADVDAHAPVLAGAVEADEDAVGDGRPRRVARAAVKARLKERVEGRGRTNAKVRVSTWLTAGARASGEEGRGFRSIASSSPRNCVRGGAGWESAAAEAKRRRGEMGRRSNTHLVPAARADGLEGRSLLLLRDVDLLGHFLHEDMGATQAPLQWGRMEKDLLRTCKNVPQNKTNNESLSRTRSTAAPPRVLQFIHLRRSSQQSRVRALEQGTTRARTLNTGHEANTSRSVSPTRARTRAQAFCGVSAHGSCN